MILSLHFKFEGRFFCVFSFPNSFIMHRWLAFLPPSLSLLFCFLIKFLKVKSGGEIVLLSLYNDMPLFYLHLCIKISYSDPAKISSLSV